MLYAIGDSHALHTFEKTPVTIVYLGPVTMRRVMHPEDDTLYTNLKNKTSEDTVFLCFGEIDCRCHVAPILEHRTITAERLLLEWAEAYLDKIYASNVNNSKIVVVSLPPPSIQGKLKNKDFPVNGSEQDRVYWTTLLNHFLQCTIGQYPDFGFFNTYGQFANHDGLLDKPHTKDFVHIHNPKVINEMLLPYL